jgi:hypothetical protein
MIAINEHLQDWLERKAAWQSCFAMPCAFWSHAENRSLATDQFLRQTYTVARPKLSSCFADEPI